MKRFLCILLVLQLITIITIGQAPNLLNYQGVARNSVGNVLPNKTIKLRLSIRDGSAAGAIVYSETRSIVTNPVGLFNVQVGSAGASNVTGSIAGINWGGGAKFMQVEVDPDNGNAFTTLGASQLLSVPYALYSTGGAPTGPAGGDLNGTYPNPAIAANAVVNSKIANNAVTTAKVADANITNPKLADGAVTTPKIANGAITQVKIGPGVTLPPSGPAGGDLTGAYPNPTILVNAVTTPKIADANITTAKLANAAVTTSKLADGSVTTPKIADNAVTTAKVMDMNITTGKLADGSVTTPKIADNAVTTAKVMDMNITTAKLADGSVTTPKIADNAVTTAKVMDMNITTAKLADGSVTTPKIADNAVTTAKVMDMNITTAKLADGSVTTPKIADNAVTTAKVMDMNITTAKLADGSVTTPKIADNAVTTAKVMDMNITTAKLADGSVTTPKLADDAVTTAKVVDANITTAKLADDAVTTAKVLDANITTPKLADGAVTQIKIGPGVTLPPSGPAGGDLSGVYPNPTVAKLQGVGVSAAAPLAGQVLKYDGANWAPAALGGGGFTLPFITTENNAGTLFSITNDGDGTSVEGVNNTATSNIAAVRGIVSSASPGGFSSAVRGINNGSGGLGIGVYGSQAGSGWGVYGTTPNGLGVYGNATANGFGVYANSNTGTGLNATSNNGIPANMSIFNNANNNSVLTASTVGNGTVINVTTTGNGAGVRSATGAGFALHGISSQQSSAGVVGDNTGGGEAVVGRNTSDIAGAVVGRNDGGGYGVRGFIATNTSNTGVGVLGQVGLGGSTGRAGRFENFNNTNTEANILEVASNSNGNIPDNTLGNASSFFLDNTNSVGAAVRAEVNTIFGNFGAAGVFGISSGTGGRAGLFYASNPAGNGASLIALTDGNGNAITANAGKDGNGVETNIDGAGDALYAWVPSFSNGRAGRFEIFNEGNNKDVITVKTVGNGTAGNFMVDRTTGTSPAVKGEVNSQFANFGTAGIFGESSGTGGYAGLFYSSNPAGNGPALLALTEGTGNGLTANAGGSGDGVEASCDGGGNAISGFIPNFGTGKAGRFANFNSANGQPVVHVTTNGTGNTLLINHQGPSGSISVFQSAGVNVARINKAGRGFFNGGTQNSGADIAEAFDVTGTTAQYEPGDVLVIATDRDRAVEKSAGPYSTLVAGVYATKPGVLLTEENIDSDLAGKVPMGVVGVIPTKVCMEGGAIKRGDLIVTSSISGVAMKADPDKVKIGQVIGKALQDFNTQGVGKINVLVSIK